MFYQPFLAEDINKQATIVTTVDAAAALTNRNVDNLRQRNVALPSTGNKAGSRVFNFFPNIVHADICDLSSVTRHSVCVCAFDHPIPSSFASGHNRHFSPLSPALSLPENDVVSIGLSAL